MPNGASLANDQMPETVHERVGRLEQEVHTVKFQVGKLEEWPPRVTDLERTVQDLNLNMIHLQRSQQETRDEVKSGFSAMDQEIKSGFRELREFAANSKGNKSGFSRGIQIAIAAITIGAAGAGAAIWYSDASASSAPVVVGMAAQCNDGTYTANEGRGACSGHGGVKRWMPE